MKDTGSVPPGSDCWMDGPERLFSFDLTLFSPLRKGEVGGHGVQFMSYVQF